MCRFEFVTGICNVHMPRRLLCIHHIAKYEIGLTSGERALCCAPAAEDGSNFLFVPEEEQPVKYLPLKRVKVSTDQLFG